ncbi:hypothetical protein, partial [Chengkuizengella axinellae]
FKIVAQNLLNNEPIKPVHLQIVINEGSRNFESKYCGEFRPWYYDRFDKWHELDLSEEISKFCKKVEREFEDWTGINPDSLHDYVENMKAEKQLKIS